jgi:hypothetical protein
MSDEVLLDKPPRNRQEGESVSRHSPAWEDMEMGKKYVLALAILVSILSSTLVAESASLPAKQNSALFPAHLATNARANVKKYDWAAKVHDRIVRAAQPWMDMSEDELWELMFGNTIERSWMVWSSGHCPVCGKSVPMYNWKIDAFKYPWKVRCPHCGELFPKNDFAKFYQSGLEEHGVFNPKLADRSLLFNAEHPDPEDPLHKFCVDDGSGYVEDDKRWRFIGAYLIYGQWRQMVVSGIRLLAQAFVVTGDPAYSRRAGILLDRVADLYPTFDFGKQGIVYERPANRGYVTMWHDACEEALYIALAYDQVFEALRKDGALVKFLSRKAKQYKLKNPKRTFKHIQRNIEERILYDTLHNRHKIESNFPRTDVTMAVIKAVLAWPKNRDEIRAMLDGVIKKATSVDGVTGEKGLAGYATYGPRWLANILGQFTRIEPKFLAEIYKRHPQLYKTYRFHIDTWCLGQYHPHSGDTGRFATKTKGYVGLNFARPGSLRPSNFTFLWNLYELTNDPVFIQVLYHANDNSVEGLPYDILASDPEAFQKDVAAIIAREGKNPRLVSVNKQQWHLAIMRSGEGKDARAVWLDYDAGGAHGHYDGMNLGLYSNGLDLMPDFGYPPVHHGGWRGTKFTWYLGPASHNTVVVNGQRQKKGAGRTTLWADGKRFHAIRASAPALISGKQYERTVAVIDTSENDFYVVDIFRVVGGRDHAKFFHSHFGKIKSHGLSLGPAKPYGHGTQMRNFKYDPKPDPGWRIDWIVEDRYKYLTPHSGVHLRYTDLTSGAQAYTAEGWIFTDISGSREATWIPRVMVRRQSKKAPLASAFAAVIEPYEKTANIVRIRRLPLETPSGDTYPDANVAIEIQLADGRRDLIVAADIENPLGLSPSLAKDHVLVQKEWRLKLDGQLCFVRLDAKSRVRRVAIYKAKSASIGDFTLTSELEADFMEVRVDKAGRVTTVARSFEAAR